MLKLRNSSEGYSNPDSLDREFGILPLSYRTGRTTLNCHITTTRTQSRLITFVSFFIGVMGLPVSSIIRSFEPKPTGDTQICCMGIVKGV